MAIKSAEPQLYSVDDAGAPTLHGMRDTSGYVSFPAQSYGSERTGDHGSQLQTVALSGLGTVRATAAVQMYHGDDITTPFTVASIALDEGPLVRGVLADPDGIGVGSRVRAITVACPADGETSDTTAELRFARINDEERP